MLVPVWPSALPTSSLPPSLRSGGWRATVAPTYSPLIALWNLVTIEQMFLGDCWCRTFKGGGSPLPAIQETRLFFLHDTLYRKSAQIRIKYTRLVQLHSKGQFQVCTVLRAVSYSFYTLCFNRVSQSIFTLSHGHDIQPEPQHPKYYELLQDSNIQ